jgi:hypothetical protein
MHCVDRMQSFSVLKQVVHSVTCQRTAKQRLDNTPRYTHATVEPASKQWLGKHTSAKA